MLELIFYKWTLYSSSKTALSKGITVISQTDTLINIPCLLNQLIVYKVKNDPLRAIRVWQQNQLPLP